MNAKRVRASRLATTLGLVAIALAVLVAFSSTSVTAQIDRNGQVLRDETHKDQNGAYLDRAERLGMFAEATPTPAPTPPPPTGTLQPYVRTLLQSAKCLDSAPNGEPWPSAHTFAQTFGRHVHTMTHSTQFIGYEYIWQSIFTVGEDSDVEHGFTSWSNPFGRLPVRITQRFEMTELTGAVVTDVTKTTACPQVSWFTTPTVGVPISLTAIEAGESPSFNWKVNGIQFSGNPITVTFTQPGVHNVVVTATNWSGSVSNTVPITVSGGNIFLPIVARECTAAVESHEVYKHPYGSTGYWLVILTNGCNLGKLELRLTGGGIVAPPREVPAWYWIYPTSFLGAGYNLFLAEQGRTQFAFLLDLPDGQSASASLNGQEFWSATAPIEAPPFPLPLELQQKYWATELQLK